MKVKFCLLLATIGLWVFIIFGIFGCTSNSRNKHQYDDTVVKDSVSLHGDTGVPYSLKDSLAKYHRDPRHACVDPCHTLCDGICQCDGLGCQYDKVHLEHPDNMPIIEDGYTIHYQDENTLVLMDGREMIYTFKRNSEANNRLFRILDNDNK